MSAPATTRTPMSATRAPTGSLPRLAVLVALATALALLVAPRVAAQEDDVTPARVAGENRYETAAQIAALDHDTSHDVFIASGENYPDALAASYAAGQAGDSQGPILLTTPGDLTDPTREALDDLAPERVFIIGGTAAVHPEVEEELEGRGYDEVVRIAGDNRYETAASLAFAWGTGPHGDVGTLGGDRTALLASGADFPDALAAGPVAANAQLPLFLLPPNEPHPAVDERLDDLDIDRVVLIGGPAALTGAVVDYYEDAGYEVERWGGENRMDTATVVADNARSRLGFDVSLSLLARGDNFPDALAASAHAGLHAAPILLTWDPDTLGAETDEWLRERCPEVGAIRAVGGEAAVSSTVLDEAVSAAAACLDDPPTNNQSYIIGPQEPIAAEPGWEQEFHLIGAYDGGAVTAGELALFPCEYVHRDGAYVTFSEDPDNPGHARGAGETDTDAAWISQINDVEQTSDQRRDRGFEHEGYSFHVASEAPDCTLPVIWDSEGDQHDELQIDADGEPTVRFGVGEVRWAD